MSATDICPVGRCDEVKEHQETLYNEEHGIKTKLNTLASKIDIEFERRPTKKAIWVLFITFFIPTLSFAGFLWVNARAVPELKTIVINAQERSIRTEEHCKSLEKRNEQYYQQILSELQKINRK